MEEDKVLHGILLKKAKEAQYTNYEIEQLNLQSEKYMKKIKNYISLLKK